MTPFIHIKPKFVHDCEACRFVGRLDGMDCYVHDNEKFKTVVLRKSGDGPDYLSTSFFPSDTPNEPYATVLRMGDPA